MKEIRPLLRLLTTVALLVQECALLLVVQDVQTNVQINVQDVLVLAQEVAQEDVPVAVLVDASVLVKETVMVFAQAPAEMTDVAQVVSRMDVEEVGAGKTVCMIVALAVGRDINRGVLDV